MEPEPQGSSITMQAPARSASVYMMSSPSAFRDDSRDRQAKGSSAGGEPEAGATRSTFDARRSRVLQNDPELPIPGSAAAAIEFDSLVPLRESIKIMVVDAVRLRSHGDPFRGDTHPSFSGNSWMTGLGNRDA